MQILVSKQRFSQLSTDIKKRYADIIKITEDGHLAKLSRDDDRHQGIVLKTGDLLEKIPLDDLINEKYKNGKSCGFMLDRVQDPHNIGAIIRSAYCFGCDFLIMPRHDAPAINATIIRTSAGFSESLPIYTVNNLAMCMTRLKDMGYAIAGLDSNANAIDPQTVVQRHDKIVFVLGSEGDGMRKIVQDNCDEIVKIKMINAADSLNVSNAAAIVGYEFYKNYTK
jgi:23S rRNA (guanosine2251-2'-O)-methyltransferase